MTRSFLLDFDRTSCLDFDFYLSVTGVCGCLKCLRVLLQDLTLWCGGGAGGLRSLGGGGGGGWRSGCDARGVWGGEAADEILGMASTPGTAAGTGLVSTPQLLRPCISGGRRSFCTKVSSDRTALGSSRSGFLASTNLRNW